MSQGTLALQSSRVIEQLESLVHHYGSQLDDADPLARQRITSCVETLQDILVDSRRGRLVRRPRYQRQETVPAEPVAELVGARPSSHHAAIRP